MALVLIEFTRKIATLPNKMRDACIATSPSTTGRNGREALFGRPAIHAGSVELEKKEEGKWVMHASLVEVERPRTMEIIESGQGWMFFHEGIPTAGAAEKGVCRLSITTRDGCAYKSEPFGPAK